MTHIFFFDIDNTLLDHRTKAIPPSALKAIAGLRRAGHMVVVATGRSYGHARPFIEQVQPDYAITQNGARILKGEQEVLSVPLARQPLIELFAWMQAQGHAYGVNRGETGYLSALLPHTVGPLRTVDMPAQSDDPFYLRQDVHQGWLFFDEALDALLMPQIRARYPEFALVRWHRTAVDVMPASVNKWTGCQWVMAQTGYQREQAIAFGDGRNDIQMLQGVGLGIAMDNGHPELKAVADRIAPALHLDGIALTLEELLRALPAAAD
jgi:Cof subfamily protein (haloacid dehalogenase superfamily)